MEESMEESAEESMEDDLEESVEVRNSVLPALQQKGMGANKK